MKSTSIKVSTSFMIIYVGLQQVLSELEKNFQGINMNFSDLSDLIKRFSDIDDSKYLRGF